MAVKRQRLLRAAVTTAAALLAGGLAYQYVGEINRPFRKWAAMGLAFLFLAPVIGWQVFFPPVVDITAHSDSVDYEFRDPEFAMEFAQLNGVEIKQ